MAVGDQQAELGWCLVLSQGGLRDGAGFGFTAHPAVLHPQYLQRPIHFPGWIPNSAVLQRMWQPWEVGGSGAHTQLASRATLQPSGSRDDLWLQRRRRRHAKWQQKLIHWLGEEASEDEGEELILEWASESLSPQEQLYPEPLGSEELATQSFQLLTQRRSGEVDVRTETYLRRFRYRYGRSLWQESYEHLPRFLQFFVVQNWFRKLFPIFTLEVRGVSDPWEARAGVEGGRRLGCPRAGPQRAAPAVVPRDVPRDAHGGRPGLAVDGPSGEGSLDRPRAHPARPAEAAARHEQRPL